MIHIPRLPVSECGRLVANALHESVAEMRKDNDTRMSEYVHTKPPVARVNALLSTRITTAFREDHLAFREEISAFRECEEKRLAQLVFHHVSRGSTSV